MIFRHDYSDNELEYYEELNRCTIRDDSVLFATNEYIYEISFFNLVDYIINYYEDCYLCNADGLCDYIAAIAEGYDLNAIVRLVDGLDTDNEFFIIDYYDNVIPFNNMGDLAEIYDIAEVINDLITKDELFTYCTKISGF